jgi:hypothetical protein
MFEKSASIETQGAERTALLGLEATAARLVVKKLPRLLPPSLRANNCSACAPSTSKRSVPSLLPETEELAVLVKACKKYRASLWGYLASARDDLVPHRQADKRHQKARAPRELRRTV